MMLNTNIGKIKFILKIIKKFWLKLTKSKP